MCEEKYYVLERVDAPGKRLFLKMFIGSSMQFTANAGEAALFCEEAAMTMAMNAVDRGGQWLWPTPARHEVRFVLNGEEVAR